MAKVKVPRKTILLDMTAMCDVAFLLLTFFMLTTKFKPDEPVMVDTPGSVSQTILPDSDILVISIDKDGKVFMGVDNERTRLTMLEKMAGLHQIAFNPSEQTQFRLTSTFGTPINNLKTVLNATGSERTKLQQGIPTDSLNNQLKDWISYARVAHAETVNNDAKKQLRIVVKADKETKYEVVKKVIDTLMEQNLNKFNLITSLESMPEGFGNQAAENEESSSE